MSIKKKKKERNRKQINKIKKKIITIKCTNAT